MILMNSPVPNLTMLEQFEFIIPVEHAGLFERFCLEYGHNFVRSYEKSWCGWVFDGVEVRKPCFIYRTGLNHDGFVNDLAKKYMKSTGERTVLVMYPNGKADLIT